MPQLMDVLEFLDSTGNTMVKRVPDSGECEIKWGAQLTVRESQVAVFFRDGKALDIFEPGRYVLQTQNVPLVGKWVTSFGYGPTSPFRAEAYFLNMKLFPNQKWGTKEPILFKDTELKMIRLRCHGIFSIQIADPTIFLNKVVGTQGLYQDSDIADYLRSIIVSKMTDVLGKEMITVFDMPKNFNQLSLIIKQSLHLDFEGLGLSLHDFYVNSISVPPQVQEMIDTRGGMTALANMDEFIKFKAAMALESAAENPNGTAATGVGMGAGLGMGFMLPQFLQQALKSGEGGTDTVKESPMDKIKKLKELLEMGAIIKEEFETKKKKLMEEI
jgi:membrane protease subunit (stomatin/prohibitin family)